MGSAANEGTPTGTAFRIGVATYSLREFQRGLAIRMIKRLGVTQISLKDFHLPSRNRQGRKRIQERRLDHRERRQYRPEIQRPSRSAQVLRVSKACGMPMLVAAPLHENLGEIEKLAKEFDIKIAVHTHGPEDPNFPTPKIVLDAVKGMDPRMGSSAISRAFAGRRRIFCTAFQ